MSLNGHRLIDAFPFFNELDLLELRFRELDDVVDAFMVVQSEETHAGTPKPLYFDPMDARWEPWAEKVDYVVARPVQNPTSRWDRENAPRHAITEALNAYDLDDLVILSDLDEIPDKQVLVEQVARLTDGQWVGFRPKLYHYYLNLRTPQAWSGIALASVMTMRSLGAQQIRDLRKAPPLRVKRGIGGWHFAWTGGPEVIQQKIGAWAHEEFDTPLYRDPDRLKARIAQRRHLFDRRPGQFWVVPLTELPGEVQAHPDRYASLLVPES